MANFPGIPGTIEMMRRYRDKGGYTNAQLAVLFNSFGWTWSETRVADLMTGRSKLTADEEIFFKLFLLDRYHEYNCS